MWVRSSSNKQSLQDPEWLKELGKFLNNTGNGEEHEIVRTLYYQTYFEYAEEGMPSEIAIQKAKSVAICFLFSPKSEGRSGSKMR